MHIAYTFHWLPNWAFFSTVRARPEDSAATEALRQARVAYGCALGQAAAVQVSWWIEEVVDVRHAVWREKSSHGISLLDVDNLEKATSRYPTSTLC